MEVTAISNIMKKIFFPFFILFSTLFLNLAKIILLVRAIILWVRDFLPNQLITDSILTALP